MLSFTPLAYCIHNLFCVNIVHIKLNFIYALTMIFGLGFGFGMKPTLPEQVQEEEQACIDKIPENNISFANFTL